MLSKQRYQAKLAQRPLLTQAVTTAVSYVFLLELFVKGHLHNKVLFGAGDTLAQQAVEKKGWAKHSMARTVRMAAYGGCKYDQMA